MPVRILQLTDLHLAADAAQRLKGVPTHLSLQAVLTHLAARGEAFDAVIVTGDLTHDGHPDAYRAVRGLLGRQHRATHVIPGNHDNRTAIRSVFSDVVAAGAGPLTFSQHIGGWRLIGLDSLDDGEVSGSIEPAQLRWLRDELSGDRDSPTAIFMHHPPIPVGCDWLDAIGLSEPSAFCDLIAAAPQVRVISAGHVHHASEHRLGTAAVLTSPSTGVQFDPRYGAEPVYHHVPPGYRIFELDHAHFRTEVIRLPELQYPPEGPQ